MNYQPLNMMTNEEQKIFERAIKVEISLKILMFFILFVNLGIVQKSEQAKFYL